MGNVAELSHLSFTVRIKVLIYWLVIKSLVATVNMWSTSYYTSTFLCAGFPDQVSMSIANHAGPMMAGKKYDLQCDVQNFAPVNVLSVSWYKGDTLLRTRGFNDLPTKTPSNKTVAFKITASSNDTEAQFRCEARLKLGPGGPQPPPVVKSNVIDVAVHRECF